MANVTCTLKTATARAILIDTENIKVFMNNEKDSVKAVSAIDEVISFFGDFTKDSFVQKCAKEYKKVNRTFINILPDSFIKTEVKGIMEEGKFLDLSHVIEENESRIGLITRTIKYANVCFKFADDSDVISSTSVLCTDGSEKGIKKTINDYCTERKVYFTRIVSKTEEEVLVGMEKSLFYDNCTFVNQ